MTAVVAGTWVSVHAVHHGDQDPLLLGGVRPLVAELHRGGLVDGFFFLRYWDGGPHVRVRLRACGDPAPVEDTALRRLRAYLAENPAPDSPLHGYAHLAAEYARAEGLRDHLPRPLPNNTVHAIAYRPEVRRYGDGAALAAVERHFAESSRIALGLIAAGTTSDQRHTAALAAFLLTRAAFAPAARVSGREPEARAGWSVAPWAPSEDRLAAFEAGYGDARERVRAVAAEAARIAAGTSRLPASGSLTAWWRSVTALRDGLREAGAGANDAARIGDTCTHLLCNRLGLTLTDESYVRYLAAKVVQG